MQKKRKSTLTFFFIDLYNYETKQLENILLFIISQSTGEIMMFFKDFRRGYIHAVIYLYFDIIRLMK